jgi:glycosyltransferase involved in cell wall biosynthesis
MNSRPGMRVALLTTSVQFGGIERVLLNLLQHMDPDIELVPLVFTRTDAKETSFFDRLRALGVSYETLYVNTVWPHHVLNPIVNLKQAIGMVRKRGFDLVHSHGYRADTFGLAISKWCGLPVISTCHGFINNDKRLKFYNQLNTSVLKRFERVIAVSASMKEQLLERGLKGARIQVIPNAVMEVPADERTRTRQRARAGMNIGDREFVFGYVGRLSEEKGVEYLLQAAASLATEHNDFRVVVVGDGPARQSLESAANRLGLAGRVTFAGFQPETAPWYAAMDAFVLPSLTEGTPMALLEAMAHRLPVVASAVGGVPAVVSNRENGLLVPPAEVSHLANAMRMIESMPSLRETLSERGIETVRSNYGVRTWIQNVRDVYLETGAR